MKLTVDRFWEVLQQYPASRYVVAYSGGADSAVLLTLCARLNQRGLIGKLWAVHIHHGLHPHANQWSDHCRQYADSLSIEFRTLFVKAAPQRGESPEDAARKARYQAFEDIVSAGDILLTAHHQDDQAETILLQLFRGAGVDGLCGMGETMNFGPAKLVRPLLSFSRQSILDYALGNRLTWVDDNSNQDSRFDRNYVRQMVLPVVRERWPSAAQTIARSGRHVAEAKGVIASKSGQLLRQVLNPIRQSLNNEALKILNETDRSLVVRHWIRQMGFRNPSTVILYQIIRDMVQAGRDRNPRVAWDHAEVSRFAGELYVFPKRAQFDHSKVIRWDGKDTVALPGDNGYLTAVEAIDGGISANMWQNGRITVRFRRGGESGRLSGRTGRRSLKKLFQESLVPPWVRNRIPLIYIDDALAAVAGMWTFQPFAAQAFEKSYRIQWAGHKLAWKIGDSDANLV